MFPVLETKRLYLRELTKADAKSIFSCFSNGKVTRYYRLETFVHLEEAENLIHIFKKNYNDKRGIRWGIERKETKEVMGTIGFNAWVPYHKKQSLVTNSIQNTGGTGTFQKRCQKFFLTVLKR